ncbi:MAG: tetratricopeptide repeat protein, partial [Chloroflexota bacterium]
MSVPGERSEIPQSGPPAETGTSSLPLVATNADMLAWLDVLLKGRPEQQALARTEIAMILEARGHTADAEEAYWTNVQARCTDRRAYERLIAIYQANGDRLSESLVRQQLDEVFNAAPGGGDGAGQEGTRQASAGRSTGLHGRSAQAGAHPGGPGTVHRGSRPGVNGTPPVQRVRRLRSARQHPDASPSHPEANGTVPALPPPVESAAQYQASPVEPPAPAVVTPPPVTATGPGSAAGHAYAAIVQSAQAGTPQPVPQPAPTPPPTQHLPAASVSAVWPGSTPGGQAAPRSATPVAGEVVRPAS